MIGFVYKNKVEYITRIEDFMDYMVPEVYDALIKALDCGIASEKELEYIELKQDYESLLSEYDELEYECDSLHDDVEEYEERMCEAEQKYETLYESIKGLVNQIYLKYIPQEDIIPKLEDLVR